MKNVLNKNRSRQAFTLIELLVVVSIIALLVAILMPALGSAREQARKTVCLTHMRGMGTLVSMYAQDREDVLPQADDSFLLKTYNPNRKDLGIEYGTLYYTYTHQKTFSSIDEKRGGPEGLGYLWKAKLIESESELPFCPSTKNLFGLRTPSYVWNAENRPSHWNFVGPEERGGKYLFYSKDDGIGWMNLRLSIGVRQLAVPGVRGSYKTVQNAIKHQKRAFLSDLWVAVDRYGSPGDGSYWFTRESDIQHQTGKQKSINAWYLDGHGENVSVNKDNFVNRNGVNYLHPDTTWTTLLDFK